MAFFCTHTSLPPTCCPRLRNLPASWAQHLMLTLPLNPFLFQPFLAMGHGALAAAQAHKYKYS